MFFFLSVAQQLEQVILKLVQTSFGKQMFDKVCDCLLAYREACIARSNPNLYNDYLRELKFTLNSLKKPDLILDIAAKNVGLITKTEHPQSKDTDQDAEEFLAKTQEQSGDQAANAEAEAEVKDDLLDEL